MPTAAWRVAPATAARGRLRVPGDKSVSHRALMLGGIAGGATHIEGFLEGEDCLATLAALRALGVPVARPAPGIVEVQGVGRGGLKGCSQALDMGNAGTAMRLFMGLLAGQAFDSTLVGDASLMRRPMERAAAPLRLMGAHIDTREGRPPVHIRGGRRLRGIDFAMPVASAQVKSAVLLAGLHAEGETRVTEPAVTRDHTERMLGGFGVDIRREGATAILRGGQRLEGAHIAVPGDFSSAAFFMVAGSIAGEGELVLENVGLNPTRTGLLELLLAMGADITVTDDRRDGGPEPVGTLIVRPARLLGIEVPEHVVPLAIDEFPVFFIAAACAEGPSLLRGAEELRVKESDRLAVMAEGMRALGVEHELLPDGMRLAGRRGAGPVFRGGAVDSHGDHRIAMSFAVASLQAAADIRIADVANVATSFPGFAELVRSIGLSLEAV